MARRVVGVKRYSLYEDLRARTEMEPDELSAIAVLGHVFQNIDVAIPENSLWWRMVHIREGRVLHTRKIRTQNERHPSA